MMNKHNTNLVKRYEQRMPAVWHPSRQWNWCQPKNEKKVIKPIFTVKGSEVLKFSGMILNLVVLANFGTKNYI